MVLSAALQRPYVQDGHASDWAWHGQRNGSNLQLSVGLYRNYHQSRIYNIPRPGLSDNRNRNPQKLGIWW